MNFYQLLVPYTGNQYSHLFQQMCKVLGSVKIQKNKAIQKGTVKKYVSMCVW